MNVLSILVIAIWLLFTLFWITSAFYYRSTSGKIFSGVFFLPLFIVFIVWYLNTNLGSAFLPIPLDNVFISLTGLIITCIGLGFACLARIHLGKNWSSIPEIKKENTLIKTGPYQIVRHPIYTGFLVGIIGSALMIGSFLFFYIFVVVLIVFIIKIRIEEKLMLTRFPDEYTQYKKDVKALIPCIY